MCSLISQVAEPSGHPVDVGQRTEAIVLAELVKRGHTVLVPFGTNHRYDFVLDTPHGFLRVQCKTGRLSKGVIRFNTVSIRSNTKQSFFRPYDGEADLFLVYCPETDRVYALDIEEAASGKGALRVAPTASGQAKGVRWAKEYELPA
jgi:PD-(D/E)XK endonuclease